MLLLSEEATASGERCKKDPFLQVAQVEGRSQHMLFSWAEVAFAAA